MYDIVESIQLGSEEWQIVDARSKAKFDGDMPEPKGLRKGHITGSVNIPYGELVDHGCLKSDEDLKAIFDSRGLDLNKKTVFSCGSGVAACIAELAWTLCGGSQGYIYDGSWSEYVSHFPFLVRFSI